VADVACGTGWSSIAMARAYPKITVDGFDLDPDVVAAAHGPLAGAGTLGDDAVRRAVADGGGIVVNSDSPLALVLTSSNNVTADQIRVIGGFQDLGLGAFIPAAEEGGPPVYGTDAFPLQWPATLDRLLALAPPTVVPGHGEPLDGDRDRRLLGCSAQLAVAAAAQKALIEFHDAAEQLSFRSHHGPAQLVQPRPCGLIGTEPEGVLQPPRRHPVLLRGDEPDRGEPGRQRRM
jgi:SAM-dependent methyltransferase